ncbi:MAG: mechanosensitive ion channel family protein [Gemmatimonadaceae bacterium]
MNIDLGVIATTISGLGTSFLGLLPRLVLASIVFLAFVAIGKGVRTLARGLAQRHGDTRTLEMAIGRLVQAGVLLVGALVSVTAAFPTFTIADLVSTLGIGGVALGFAFKDIFQNFVAGILILIGRPFRVGDQIRMGEHEGTVDEILARATYLKTYDGRRVIIPNSDLFTNAVTVNTAFATRRMEYDLGIGYGDDIDAARAIVLDVLQALDGVLPDPKADVIVVALADSTVTLRARWWSSSRISDLLVSRDKVLTQCKQRLSAAGIDLAFPTHQILFHDQTEDSDGDRTRQREGWPAGKSASPRPAGIARAVEVTAERDRAETPHSPP